MQLKAIDDQLSIGGQIAPEDVAQLAAQGFHSIICNRPDDEDPGQPSFSEIAQAAEEYGMVARHIPVRSGQVEAAQAAQFEAALKELPSPTFAYCRSGGRAGVLAQMIGRASR